MLNNKVILQIVPALNNGGVERGVIETSKFLVKNNNKSIVISSGGVYEHLISRHGGILYKLDVHLKNPLKWKNCTFYQFLQLFHQLIKKLSILPII